MPVPQTFPWRTMKSKHLRYVESLAVLRNHSTPQKDSAEESRDGQYSKAREGQTVPFTPARKESLAEVLFSEPLLNEMRERYRKPWPPAFLIGPFFSLDYFSQPLFLKNLQKICIGCLAVGVCKCFWIHLEKNTDHADAAFGCSNASLSLTNVRELLPQSLCGR